LSNHGGVKDGGYCVVGSGGRSLSAAPDTPGGYEPLRLRVVAAGGSSFHHHCSGSAFWRG
jgi:hypothetical protein